jgi:hypothetical protein
MPQEWFHDCSTKNCAVACHKALLRKDMQIRSQLLQGNLLDGVALLVRSSLVDTTLPQLLHEQGLLEEPLPEDLVQSRNQHAGLSRTSR